MTPEQIAALPRYKLVHDMQYQSQMLRRHDGGWVKYSDAVNMIEVQAIALATMRAERDALKAGILSSAGAEYILEHPMETDAERMGRHSAVRGMMVRLGLYPQLEKAIDDAIALKGGA